MTDLPSRARMFVAGADDFAAVLAELERQRLSFVPRSPERAAAMFELIEWCAVNAQPAPAGIAHELMIAHDLWAADPKDAPTLDAALGLRRPSKAQRGADLPDYKHDGLAVAAAVVRQIEQRKSDGAAVGDELFAAVGAALQRPMSGAAVKALYYEHRGRWQVRVELQAVSKNRANS